MFISLIKEDSLEMQMIEAYNSGVAALEKGDVLYATKKFNEAELLYPQSIWAPRSSLMSAYSLYSQMYFIDAIEEIEGLSLTGVPDYAENNHWLNVLQIDSDLYCSGRDKLMTFLDKKGIQTRPVWSLNHMQKPYKDNQIYKIAKAFKLEENSLCLPSSTNLNDSEIDILINLLSS